MNSPMGIDFDQNATTSLSGAARAAMQAYLDDPEAHGNPSSAHGRGRRARELIERARRQVAQAVQAEPLGLTFCSGGTEADNLAILGVSEALQRAGKPSGVLSSPIEHPAVGKALASLQVRGRSVHFLQPDPQGRIRPEDLAQCLSENPEIGLVSLAGGNHELGNAYPLEDFVRAVRETRAEVLVHSDCVQAFGKRKLAFADWDLDLMSLSAHKIGGPKGVGALVHRPGLEIAARTAGGSQERGRRTGTQGVPAIVGFGAAAAEAGPGWRERRAHFEPLRARLREGLLAQGVEILGDAEAHTGNTVLAYFKGCQAQLLLMNLDLEGVYVSTGAACSAGGLSVNATALALGRAPEVAQGVVRFSLGTNNHAEEVDRVLELLGPIVERVRNSGGLN